MGQDPDQIRQQIEQTRDDMGDTIDAIGYKADVPARAKEKVADTVTRARESVTGTVGSMKEAVAGGADSVRGAAPDPHAVSGQARRAVGTAQRNPLGLAVGSVAVGFLAGMLLPTTRIEEERIGPMASDVKEHVAEVGQEALEHGKQIAREAAESASETVAASASEHAEELRETAQQHAQSVTGGSARSE